jgi:hypothetical protein
MSAAITAAVVGGGLALSAANKSSKAATNAANTSAAAQLAAGQQAAEAAKFRPVDVNNAFGSSQVSYGPDGYVSGINVNPSALSNQLLTGAQGQLGTYQGLFDQYGGQGLQQGSQTIYDQLQALQAPGRATQQTNLFDTLQAKGITGVSGYDPRTGMAANPYASSLFGGFAAADAQSAYDSQQQYLNRLQQLQGGLTQAQGNVVAAGEVPINNVLGISAQLGGRNANATGSNALLQSGLGAAQTAAQGQVASAAYKNSFWSGFGADIGNTVQGVGNTLFGNSTATGSNPQFSTGNYFNPTGFGTGVGGSGYQTDPNSQQSAMLASQW